MVAWIRQEPCRLILVVAVPKEAGTLTIEPHSASPYCRVRFGTSAPPERLRNPMRGSAGIAAEIRALRASRTSELQFTNRSFARRGLPRRSAAFARHSQCRRAEP